VSERPSLRVEVLDADPESLAFAQTWREVEGGLALDRDGPRAAR
jgi:hypothetical protein